MSKTEFKEVKIPKKSADKAFERITDLLDKYHEQRKLQDRFLNMPVKNQYNLKWLCLSCYIQGLSDGKEIIESKLNEK